MYHTNVRTWRKNVPVGSIQYKIVLASRAEMSRLAGGLSCDGLTDIDNATIYILDDIAPERFMPVLLHELSHAALDGGPLGTLLEALNPKKWNEDTEEAIIRSIESALAPALAALGWRPRKNSRDPRRPRSSG